MQRTDRDAVVAAVGTGNAWQILTTPDRHCLHAMHNQTHGVCVPDALLVPSDVDHMCHGAGSFHAELELKGAVRSGTP